MYVPQLMLARDRARYIRKSELLSRIRLLAARQWTVLEERGASRVPPTTGQCQNSRRARKASFHLSTGRPAKAHAPTADQAGIAAWSTDVLIKAKQKVQCDDTPSFTLSSDPGEGPTANPNLPATAIRTHDHLPLWWW